MAAGGRASEQKGLYSGRRSKVNGMWSAVKSGVEWRRGARSSYSGFEAVIQGFFQCRSSIPGGIFQR